MANPRPSRASHVSDPSSCAVLIDGSALYLATRSLYEGSQLDYRELIDVLVDQVQGVKPPLANDAHWVMWTAASAQNAGQTRFLDFAENQLRWSVRRFSPVDSYMVEPTSLIGMSGDSRTSNRLMRFDASIAFAIGRLAGPTCRIVVLSDSYALADPLIRAGRVCKTKPTVAFFGRAIDSRWPRALRSSNAQVDFLDLDEFEFQLFGAPEEEVVQQFEDDDYVF